MKNTFKFTLWALLSVPFMIQSCKQETVKPNSKNESLEMRGYCESKCYQEETAWGDGCNYSKKGGWATYSKYGANHCVTLWGGQNINVGTACFSCVNNGKVTITIQLACGWELAPGKESVKIEKYSSAPCEKPVPGKFTYKGSCLTVEVDAACFYGIHLDVRKEVPCI